MHEEIRLDPSIKFKDTEEGDLYYHLFPRDNRYIIHGLGLLPQSCKSVDFARAISEVSRNHRGECRA
jgi:hypothetical protein